MTKTYILVTAALLLCLLPVGCGKVRPIEVKGTVTYRGEPISKGAIQFSPSDGMQSEGGGTIENGRFIASVLPGEKIVRIRGLQVNGTKRVELEPGRIVDVDISVPLTSQKEHWDESSIRVLVDSKNRSFNFEIE